MKIHVEVTLMGGWVDAPTPRLAESMSREYDLAAVPRKGDYIDTGRSDEPVEVVFWPLHDGPPLVRLRAVWTGEQSMDDAIAQLETNGWTR